MNHQAQQQGKRGERDQPRRSSAPSKPGLWLAEANEARSELYDTLGKLRKQLDYAQRIDDSIARARHRIAAQKRESPALFAAAVAGVAVGCGAAVWAIAARMARALR